MKPKYAILRVGKIHTRGQLKARADHNNRDQATGLEHTDPKRSAGALIGNPDTVQAWDDAMRSKGLTPAPSQKGGVIALEWIATASPEWWQSADEDQRAAWAADSIGFIQKQAGGAENVLSVWWHDDETTPHLHAVSIPLVEKARKPRGRVRAGRTRPPATIGWGLSAKDLIGGNRERMSQLQDDYAIEMSRHGLARGVPRKETGARNRSPAKWRAEQARLTDQMHTDAQAISGIRIAADIYRQTAIETANETMAKAKQAHDYAQELGARVKADAAQIGRAISFSAYENDPKNAQARLAIDKAKKAREQGIEAQRARNENALKQSMQSTQRREQFRGHER